ncbi:MAG: hypothetical protein QME60_07030, partial [Verrucomicrobiota bacterium]|nr:hypothetical protein [Verrucomicrobiota bacterium]
MKMKTETREERLAKLRSWHARCAREGKSRLLSEVCAQYGYSRKHAIKLLRGSLPKRGKRRRGATLRYEPICEVVERIWQAAEQVCGKRLAAA